MGIRIGPPRIGHRLPGGFWVSATLTPRRGSRPGREASPRAQTVIALIVGGVFILGTLAVGAWPLALGGVAATVYLVLRARAGRRRAVALAAAQAAVDARLEREGERIDRDNAAWVASVRDRRDANIRRVMGWGDPPAD